MNGQVSQGVGWVDVVSVSEPVSVDHLSSERYRAQRPTLIRGGGKTRREANAAHPWLMAITWICCSLGFCFYYAAIPGFTIHPCPPLLVEASFESLVRANGFCQAGILLSIWLCTRPALWDRIGGVVCALCGIGIWLAMNSL